MSYILKWCNTFQLVQCTVGQQAKLSFIHLELLYKIDEYVLSVFK